MGEPTGDEPTGGEPTVDVRERLVLGLDVGDLAAASDVARRLAPWFGVVKVGHELYAEAGPGAIEAMKALGFAVFLDLKLHDIPNTVERAARAHARHGADMVDAHAAGGEAMLRAFVTGARDGARDAGLRPPVTLAVTVLTSEPDASAFATRLDVARLAGCDGVVCSPHEIGDAAGTGMRTMVPGIRRAGDDPGDQARFADPGAAIRAGATWLVIGRTVTSAADPEAAAAMVSSQTAGALAGP